MVRLSEAALAKLPSQVEVPRYDRSEVRAGIVHFGVGGFHRAHQAMYIDRLLNAGGSREWGICGIGVLEGDRRMKDALESQDHLYTLVLKHPDGSLEPRVVGSIIDYLLAPDDPQAVIEKLADAEVRIVSLTITEGGYNFDQITGEFDVSNPGVQADLVPGATPRTVFGLIVAGLRRRRERGLPPFTLMSCDNVPGNGEMAKKVFTAFARLSDPEFADWMEASVHFPNSMVDRITPVTTDEDRALVAREWGIEDAWPVVAEPFEQWALEEDFGLGRPAYESVGVQVVPDVEPYELMKIRLLNSSHQGMCYFGRLSGYTYAHEAARDPLIADLLVRYMDEEATPTLRPVPGIDLDQYKRTLIERFSNEFVRDTLARLCAESSDRIPKWLLPVVREQLSARRTITRSAAIVASWARYAEGIDEEGRAIDVVDRMADQVMANAAKQRDDELAFLREKSLFGELATDRTFTASYARALSSLIADGAQATLRWLADS